MGDEASDSKSSIEVLAGFIGSGTGGTAMLLARLFEHQIFNGTADPQKLSRMLHRLQKSAAESEDNHLSATLFGAVNRALFGENDSRLLAVTAAARRESRIRQHADRPKKRARRATA